MTVITEKEFKKDVSKYLKLARTEKVVIETPTARLELGTEKRLISDEDLANALTGEELKKRMEPRIRAMFAK